MKGVTVQRTRYRVVFREDRWIVESYSHEVGTEPEHGTFMLECVAQMECRDCNERYNAWVKRNQDELRDELAERDEVWD